MSEPNPRWSGEAEPDHPPLVPLGSRHLQSKKPWPVGAPSSSAKYAQPHWRLSRRRPAAAWPTRHRTSCLRARVPRSRCAPRDRRALGRVRSTPPRSSTSRGAAFRGPRAISPKQTYGAHHQTRTGPLRPDGTGARPGNARRVGAEYRASRSGLVAKRTHARPGAGRRRRNGLIAQVARGGQAAAGTRSSGRACRVAHQPFSPHAAQDCPQLRRSPRHHPPATSNIGTPSGQKLLVEDPQFFNRDVRRHLPWEVILCVDQSGSMTNSVIHAAESWRAYWPGCRWCVRLVVFDTAVVDPIGARERSGRSATRRAARRRHQHRQGGAALLRNKLVSQPRRTVLALITDFCEGADPRAAGRGLSAATWGQVSNCSVWRRLDEGGESLVRRADGLPAGRGGHGNRRVDARALAHWLQPPSWTGAAHERRTAHRTAAGNPRRLRRGGPDRASANKGLVRRAQKGPGSRRPWCARGDRRGRAWVRGPGWVVTMPPEGPVRATDDTKATGVTRQILTATIYLPHESGGRKRRHGPSV